MVATLTKEDVKGVVVDESERLAKENKVVLKGAADAMEGKINDTGMELYAKILEDIVYP